MIAEVATHDADGGGTAVFLVNRDETADAEIEIDVRMLGEVGVREAWTLSDKDPHAANTLEQQDRARPVANPTARRDGGSVTISLPPVSWTALTLG